MSRSRNRFLASLPAEADQRLESVLRSVHLASESPLPGCGDSRVYFPETTVCSIFSTFADGRSIEVTSIGAEGVVGLLNLGLPAQSAVSYLQVGDGPIKYAPASLIAELCAAPNLVAAQHDRLLDRFTKQIMKLVACNQIHPLPSRCARWILLMNRRLGRARFEVSPGFLGRVMGVETGVIRGVLSRLARNSIVKHDRRTITVLDRIALRRLSCSCCAVLEADLLAPPAPALPPVMSTSHPRSAEVVPLRQASVCTLCGLGVNLPHETVTECLRALEREQLAAIRRYRALTEKRAQLMREFLQIYEKFLKNSSALNGGRFFA